MRLILLNNRKLPKCSRSDCDFVYLLYDPQNPKRMPMCNACRGTPLRELALRPSKFVEQAYLSSTGKWFDYMSGEKIKFIGVDA